ncbi:hypothetical protein TSUD_298470 [Trifolium subterraneum]|nr:hypothetical protein TSUD_298470 [Trifolium subterraneum]
MRRAGQASKDGRFQRHARRQKVVTRRAGFAVEEMNVLSALISLAQQKKFIHGVKVAPRAPEITHLFFADDSIMFCRATIKETEHMKMLLSTYQQASGQLVNYQKSELIFSKRVDHSTKLAIHQILPMHMVDHFSKYLGQPTFIGRSKNHAFSFIQDKVWKKLKGWKEKNLSFAGRGTLIKAVAQAIPTYLMSSFLLPKGLCNFLDQMTSKFWWGSNVDRRKIHWVNWKKTCNGHKINIWEDRWINPQGNNTTWTPKPVTTNLEKVKDLIDPTNHTWNEQIISQTFLPIKVPQIIQIPLTNSENEDVISWHGTNDGNYTVKSGYNAQMEWENTESPMPQTSNRHTVESFWNKLWNIKAPPKQIHLLWRIMHNAIPVKTNLIKKGWVLRSDDGRCVGAVTKVLKGSDDVALAEAMGIWEALKWVESQHLKNVIFEMDAEIIVNALKRKVYPRNRWGQIVKTCSRVLEAHKDYSIGWVKRGRNKVAHSLARWAITEPNRYWPSDFPVCIITHVQKDMEFVTFPPQ